MHCRVWVYFNCLEAPLLDVNPHSHIATDAVGDVLLLQNHVHANKQICMRIGFGSGGGSTYISPIAQKRESARKMCTYLSERKWCCRADQPPIFLRTNGLIQTAISQPAAGAYLPFRPKLPPFRMSLHTHICWKDYPITHIISERRHTYTRR
jgi:hypothetical protein